MSDNHSDGAALFVTLWVPGATGTDDPAVIADELVAIINDRRALNAGPYPPVRVVGPPRPGWITDGVGGR